MILKSNKYGFFGFCEDCREYHLHFNNLFFSLNEGNLNKFCSYLKEIDPNTSYVPEHDLILKKNIVLPVLHPYMLVLVNLEELNMLKNLILINHDYNISLTHKDFPFEHNNN
tara:strand:+ start:864 stop:1199 length:336 start_codon:yes stop_codon:yes gene_type:complete